MTIDFARTAGAGLRLARTAFFGSSLVFAGVAPALSAKAAEAPVEVATAASYAVLADGAVTNNGNTVINGDLGVHPGTAVSGFPPGVVNGQRHAGDAAAERAQADLTAAYNDAAGRTSTRTTGPDLGGQTFTPGVYQAPDNANLNGTVTLDAQGDASAVFIFQLGSTLTTVDNSRVNVVNAPGPACNVFWTVGDSATLAAGTSFVGRLMAVNAITLNSAAKIEQGGALSRDGAVSLDNNVISRSECVPVGGPARPPTAPSSPSSPTPSQTTTPTTPTPTTPTPAPTTPTPTTPTPAPAPTTPAPTTPAPTTPAPTTPGTTAPETAVPETAVPETAVPETAVPETAVPETAVPETAVPETAAPVPAVPELTVPPTAAPAAPEVQSS